MKMRLFVLLTMLMAAVVCIYAPSFAVSADPPAAASAAPAAPASASSPADAPASALAPVSDPDYRITEDDVLRLDVWGEPTLSGMQISVTPGGTASLPFLGEMKVAGLTQSEVAKLVCKKLEEAEILADAKVQITLITIHRPQARILGAVQRPCSFEFKDGDTILDAIAQGGSYSEDAMLEAVTLTHKDSTESIKINLKKIFAGDLAQNFKLQNGDALYVPHEDYNNKFFVFGQVNRPGQYSLKDKTDVLTAISLAGGQTPRATVRGTVVVRGGPAKPERVKCDLRRLFDKGDMTQDIALQAGDIVIVPETKTPDLNRISGIIGTILNVSYLNRLGWL